MDKIIYFDKFNKIKEKEYKKLYSFLQLSRKKQIDKINDINTKKIRIIEYYLIKKYGIILYSVLEFNRIRSWKKLYFQINFRK